MNDADVRVITVFGCVVTVVRMGDRVFTVDIHRNLFELGSVGCRRRFALGPYITLTRCP